MSLLKRSLLLFSSFLLLAPFCLAVDPVVRLFTSFSDFLEGESKGIAVSSDGKLMLGPGQTEILDTDEPYIYSATATEQGTVYIGTGNGGSVFRFNAAGSGKLVDLDEPGVYSLALDSRNRLYAGTGPEGNVYRISEDGQAEIFFESREKFIWDLAFDESDNLYVATGTRGIIYKISPAGEEEEFFDSQESHLVSLAFDLEGNLLAGSAPGGLLYRISTGREPEAFAMLDSELEEIKAIDVDRYGIVYAAAISGKARTTLKAEGAAAGPDSPEDNSNNGEEVAKVSTEPAGKLQVYRIDREGLVSTVYGSDTEIAFDLKVRSDGSLLLATGNKGRILALETDGFKTLLFDSEEEQVTRLISNGSALYAATSNLGKLIRIEQAADTSGEYLSPVIDSESTSQWGTISWIVSEPSSIDGISFYTRSGNTRKPGETWSDWSQPYSNKEGDRITSPSSRYLQWKLEYRPEARGNSLLADENSIESVSVSYQQYNLPPRLSSLKVHSNGIAFASNQTSPPAGGTFPGGPDGAHIRSLPKNIRELETPSPAPMPRKVYIPSTRSISWEASDPNDDDLIYDLLISSDKGRNWQKLAEDLVETMYTIDGASFSDGDYLVKVVASDSPNNPPESSLSDELVSKTFRLTNRAPEINWGDGAGEDSAVFSVTTDSARLFRVEYSLDGVNWKVAFPEDGITDSPREDYRLEIPAGTIIVRVRAVDDNGNIGTGALEIGG